MTLVLLQGKPMRKQLQFPDFKGEADTTISLVSRYIPDRYEESGEVFKIGILVQYENGSQKGEDFFGVEHEIADLVLLLRGIWFLEAMPKIRTRDCHHVYYAADRDREIFRFSSDAIEEWLGKKAFEAIMGRTFTPSMVNYILYLMDEGYGKSSTAHSLSDEVEAGTVRWSQVLKIAGVKHPDYWKAHWAAKQTILDRYQLHITSYLADCHDTLYTRTEQSMRMLMIEWRIVHGVQKGIEETYGKDITAAAGMIIAALDNDNSMEKITKKCPDEEDTWIKTDPETHFEQVARWLVRYNPALTYEKILVGLHEIVTDFDKMKIRYPLVQE